MNFLKFAFIAMYFSAASARAGEPKLATVVGSYDHATNELKIEVRSKVQSALMSVRYDISYVNGPNVVPFKSGQSFWIQPTMQMIAHKYSTLPVLKGEYRIETTCKMGGHEEKRVTHVFLQSIK